MNEVAVDVLLRFDVDLHAGGSACHSVSLPFSTLASTALKTVFVDDYADATAAMLFKIAHYAAAAIELHIGLRSHHVRRQ